MEESTSARRLAENEVIFRQANERIQQGIELVNKLAAESNQPELGISQTKDDAPLSFFCECSDEKCRERILMNYQQFNDIHKNRSRFVIKPHHQVVAIEKIVKQTPHYTIVEKNIKPPATAENLHATDLDHTGQNQ